MGKLISLQPTDNRCPLILKTYLSITYIVYTIESLFYISQSMTNQTSLSLLYQSRKATLRVSMLQDVIILIAANDYYSHNLFLI